MGKRFIGIGFVYVFAASIFACREGSSSASDARLTASRLVSQLAEVAAVNPQGVDEAIRRNPAFRQPAVRRCLAAIAQGNVAGAQAHQQYQAQLNAKYAQAGLSREYRSSAAGNALLFATSMLMALDGAPWLRTPAGAAEVQILQACPMLEMIQPGMCDLIFRIRAATVEEVKRVHGGLIHRCP